MVFELLQLRGTFGKNGMTIHCVVKRILSILCLKALRFDFKKKFKPYFVPATALKLYLSAV